MQLNLIVDIQELALNTNSNLRLSNANKFALHSLCISLLSILSFVVRVPNIFEYRYKHALPIEGLDLFLSKGPSGVSETGHCASPAATT